KTLENQPILYYNSGMIYVWLTILILLNACWLMLVLFTLPGNWLMVVSTCLFAWWKWDNGRPFNEWLLIGIAVLALIGEIIEFFAGAGGAKKAGAGWLGALAAIGGAVFGALVGTFIIPVPIVGTMLGACFGAGVATWTVERVTGKEHNASVRSGVGAGAGVLVGTLSKFCIGCLIWLLITIAAFWP
ncbi:MAG: DUF456 domain-containing protein, partial [Planctomycetota bacterium]